MRDAALKAALIALLFCAHAFAGEAEWKSAVQEGFAAKRAGDHATSARKFEAALKEAEATDPEGEAVGMTSLWLGQAYQQQKMYDEAEPRMQRALRIAEKKF